jgi:hypothetical protein
MGNGLLHPMYRDPSKIAHDSWYNLIYITGKKKESGVIRQKHENRK